MDIELTLVKFLCDLKEVKNKSYSIYDTDLSTVYVFKDKEDFRSYFIDNGIKADDDLLRTCTLKVTKKGNIIALKFLCDHAIKIGRINKELSKEEIERIHKNGQITFKEKVEEWEKNNICAPSFDKRCNKFQNCHDCMTEYAAIKNNYSKSKVKRS